jgi:hypothetical protein
VKTSYGRVEAFDGSHNRHFVFEGFTLGIFGITRAQSTTKNMYSITLFPPHESQITRPIHFVCIKEEEAARRIGKDGEMIEFLSLKNYTLFFSLHVIADSNRAAAEMSL